MCLAQTQIAFENQDVINKLNARVKNLDNFINRFNYQIDLRDNSVDSAFREKFTREQVIESLFNMQDDRLDANNKEFELYSTNKEEFIQYAVNNNYELKKDTNVTVRLNSIFKYKGKNIHVNFFLKYTAHNYNAYSWTICSVNSDAFNLNINQDISKYIPPNNDDLNFSALQRLLLTGNSMVEVTNENVDIDQLPIFLFLIKQKELTFVSIGEMEYILTGIKGWKVILKEFNRNDYNSGWLISNLEKVDM